MVSRALQSAGTARQSGSRDPGEPHHPALGLGNGHPENGMEESAEGKLRGRWKMERRRRRRPRHTTEWPSRERREMTACEI